MAIGRSSRRANSMTLDTVFDLASLTKVVATTTAVMQLMELGKVRMNDPVAKYIPDFAQNGKDDITIRQLLTHYSGLAPDLDLATPWEGKQTAYQLAVSCLRRRRRGRASYTAILISSCWENWSRRSLARTLDAYTAQHVFTPLKMTHTRYLPPAAWRVKIAPTQYDEKDKMLWGVVHDPTARRMGGVAGMRACLRTGDDLAKFAQTLARWRRRNSLTGSGRQDDIARDCPRRRRFCAGSDGTSILRFRPIAAICFLWDRTGTPASPVHRYGSIRLRTRT